MAATNTTLTGTQFAAHAITLTANTVDTVTLTGHAPQVEVVSDGAAILYVRVDGSAPTVAGPNSYILPAGVISRRVIRMPATSPGVVKLISAGAATYSVSEA